MITAEIRSSICIQRLNSTTYISITSLSLSIPPPKTSSCLEIYIRKKKKHYGYPMHWFLYSYESNTFSTLYFKQVSFVVLVRNCLAMNIIFFQINK